MSKDFRKLNTNQVETHLLSSPCLARRRDTGTRHHRGSGELQVQTYLDSLLRGRVNTDKLGVTPCQSTAGCFAGLLAPELPMLLCYLTMDRYLPNASMCQVRCLLYERETCFLS